MANYAKNLEIESISNHDVKLATDLERKNALTLDFFNVVSGVSSQFYIHIVDNEG